VLFKYATSRAAGLVKRGYGNREGNDKLDVGTLAALTLLLAVFCTYALHLRAM